MSIICVFYVLKMSENQIKIQLTKGYEIHWIVKQKLRVNILLLKKDGQTYTSIIKA